MRGRAAGRLPALLQLAAPLGGWAEPVYPATRAPLPGGAAELDQRDGRGEGSATGLGRSSLCKEAFFFLPTGHCVSEGIRLLSVTTKAFENMPSNAKTHRRASLPLAGLPDPAN